MQMHFGRHEFLEGRAVLALFLLYAFYESMIVVKAIKLRRRYQKQPL